MNAHPIATLGTFSISLAVKDLPASLAFYEKLGFALRFGDGVRWALLQNGEATLGLFQGMPGARTWRRMLSDSARLARNDAGLLLDAAQPTRPVRLAA